MSILVTVSHTRSRFRRLALSEVLSPRDASNAATTELMVEYLQVQCSAALVKMHDERTVLPQYLSTQDGALSFEKQAQAHADTTGCEATNDKFAESVFGVFDRMLQRCPGISREAASGLAQAIYVIRVTVHVMLQYCQSKCTCNVTVPQ